MHWAVRRLATAASGLLLIKGAPALGQRLGLAECPWLTAVLGPTAAAALAAPPACGSEMLCGAALCSVTGTHHVGWVVPSLPHSYYLPTAHIHGFFFFLPAFVLGGPPQWVLAGAAMLTGPLLTEIILGDDATARRHEWAAIWCMFSLGQVRTAAHCCTAAPCCTAPFSSQGGCLAVFFAASVKRATSVSSRAAAASLFTCAAAPAAFFGACTPPMLCAGAAAVCGGTAREPVHYRTRCHSRIRGRRCTWRCFFRPACTRTQGSRTRDWAHPTRICCCRGACASCTAPCLSLIHI